MFVTGHNGDDVNEYKLTIGFDISTATFVDSFDTESEDCLLYTSPSPRD